MIDVDSARFTVGVFQDLSWAQKGLEALMQAGLPPESLSIVAKESPDAASLIERHLGAGAERLDVAIVGPVLMKGPIVGALQGRTGDLAKLGLSGTMRRVGFQPHDGRIYETLTARGGVLVAIHSEPRAADALAVLLVRRGQCRHRRLVRPRLTWLGVLPPTRLQPAASKLLRPRADTPRSERGASHGFASSRRRHPFCSCGRRVRCATIASRTTRP